jgi:UDP-N-acetylglucosamine 2-epimerase (non-hydrolysing)
MTIVGTRPEIIRLSRVITRLNQTVDHVLVHTGQNYDYKLNGVFFSDLGIGKPDHFLEVDTSSLGHVLGETLIKSEEILRQERPDAVLVLGDTNSCVAALMAKRMKIPVYHMEAGNRCFDENVPEETNRRLVDHVADFNLVYTEHARHNLLAEGLHPRRIIKTGSPMREVLHAYRDRIDASPVLNNRGLTEGGYLLVSAHREENVDSPDRLRALLAGLEAVQRATDLPIFVSTHPRTRKRLEALLDWDPSSTMTFSQPLGFHDYNKLQLEAACVLSDSGTIAEESSILGFPAVTLRESIERPEALDTAAIIMTGLDARDMTVGVSLAMRQERTQALSTSATPVDYLIDNTSERVVAFILSTVRRCSKWSGTRS